jgi:phosphoglycerate dehydrogenase-like enzyme
MTKSVLTIWCNNDFTPAQEAEREQLTKGAGAHRLLFFEPDDNGQDGASREALGNADIAFGSPEARAASDCERLRWIQLNTAGYTSYDHADLKEKLTARGTRLTNSSAVYDEPCAQHLLAMMLSLARGLPLALDAQRGGRAWRMHDLRPGLRLLNGQTVLLLGYGAIARRLVELLGPLGMEVVAVRRRVQGDERVRVFQTDAVDELLPKADHVVNVLPANEETDGFLNAERLASLKRGAMVYNLGRGTTLDQNALIKELREGRLAAAYLDVTDPEPLPPAHPLWEAPNCFITPHVGGGHSTEKERQVEHFLDNLRRFERGEELRDRLL